MRRRLSIAALAAALLLVAHARAPGQATGTGDGSKTGDGSTPFTGLGQAPEANLYLGSAVTSIPFLLPPGRGSMTPQLSLNYTSYGGPSPYGHGWDLSLPRLQRSTKHGVLSCNDASLRNELVLTLPGTTIECTLDSGTCKPHVEAGFIRIKEVAGTDQKEFKVTDKSGITYTFGGTDAVTSSWNQTFAPNGEAAVTGSSIAKGFDTTASPCTYISAWMLNKVEDPNGNSIVYHYVRDGGMLYPHSIQYGGHPSGPANIYTVQFVWEARSDGGQPAPQPPANIADRVVNAIGGYAATMSYRLRTINVLYVMGLIRGYDFHYETERSARQTFLKSVMLFNDSGSVLTRADNQPAATTFAYHPNTLAGFESVAQTGTRPSLTEPGKSLRVREGSGLRRDVMDVNGDGFPDLIEARIGIQCFSAGYRYWSVFFGSRSGFSTTETRWYLPPLIGDAPACIIQGVVNGESDFLHTRFTTADITGDGIPDYIDSQISASGSMRYWTVYPGTSQSPYSPAGNDWGFGAAIQWQFAPGEGQERDYVRRTSHIDVGNVEGFSGPASISTRTSSTSTVTASWISSGRAKRMAVRAISHPNGKCISTAAMARAFCRASSSADASRR
jgi:Salmonella virulence plasmid 65kDa B protein